MNYNKIEPLPYISHPPKADCRELQISGAKRKKTFRRSSGHKLKAAGGMKEVRRVNHSEVPHVCLSFMNDTINPIAARQSRTASKTIDSIAVSPFEATEEEVNPHLSKG